MRQAVSCRLSVILPVTAVPHALPAANAAAMRGKTASPACVSLKSPRAALYHARLSRTAVRRANPISTSTRALGNAGGDKGMAGSIGLGDNVTAKSSANASSERLGAGNTDALVADCARALSIVIAAVCVETAVGSPTGNTGDAEAASANSANSNRPVSTVFWANATPPAYP